MHDSAWLKQQYQSTNNLSVRIRLHRTCSENPEDWYRWVFSFLQKRLPVQARILEIAGGKGDLWFRISDRISENWNVTVTDRFEKMVDEAREQIGMYPNFSYGVQDAEQAMEASSASCDAVIANHVIYHLQNPARLFQEARRVLKTDGQLFASVTGQDHLGDLYRFFGEIDPRFTQLRAKHQCEFFGESGRQKMLAFFPKVEWNPHADAIVIRKEHLSLLIEYVLSWHEAEAIVRNLSHEFIAERVQELFVARGEYLRFEKQEGMFIAKNR